MVGGDGGYCAADSGGDKEGIYYGEYTFLDILRAVLGRSGGIVGDNITTGWRNDTELRDIPFKISELGRSQSNFIAPFIIDPNDPERLLAGSQALWLCRNARAPIDRFTGPSWEPITITGNVAPISAITVVRGDSGEIWVGNNNGSIYKTTNGLAPRPIWARVDENGALSLPNRFCTRIVIDPKDRNHVFATFGGYKANNLWESRNSGASWSPIGPPNLQAPCYSIAIHPADSKRLYLASEVGLFAHMNGGQSSQRWLVPQEVGPNSCAVDDLQWMNHKLIVVTHGRGIWSIDLAINN
jgi:hypothetical protein